MEIIALNIKRRHEWDATSTHNNFTLTFCTRLLHITKFYPNFYICFNSYIWQNCAKTSYTLKFLCFTALWKIVLFIKNPVNS